MVRYFYKHSLPLWTMVLQWLLDYVKQFQSNPRLILGFLGSFLSSFSPPFFFFNFFFLFTFSLDKKIPVMNTKTQNLVSFTICNIIVCSIFFFFSSLMASTSSFCFSQWPSQMTYHLLAIMIFTPKNVFFLKSLLMHFHIFMIHDSLFDVWSADFY